MCVITGRFFLWLSELAANVPHKFISYILCEKNEQDGIRESLGRVPNTLRGNK